jgi:hypothetical protein
MSKTRARATHHCAAALLSCGSPASRRHPPGLEPHGFGVSRLVVHYPPRGFRTGGTRFCPNRGDLPQAWDPLQSMTRASRCRPAPDTGTLPRFSAPSATHPPRSTTPRLCLPGSSCALALTMCLDAFLPQRTPWYPFNQARFRGDPSELYLAEIADTSRCRFPSCD